LNSLVERLLYVTLAVVFIGVGVGLYTLIVLGHRLGTEQETTQRLAEQNQILSRQNQAIAKQNRAYSRCIATIFAQYTHDFVPVTIVDLDTCTTDSQTRATNSTATGGTVPAPQKSQNTPKVSNPPTQSTNSEKPSSPPPSPSLLDRLNGILKALPL
jgi:Tfp pilus assembly protein PilV